ncbi:unnamed protein product [Diabrotica balteata]|uniref:C2H2-type domain-containing protein n=1 Tax=Diabrotica balteata TaxID=107213 RepID=A0A9P0DUR5_DIABA|nr:unnamed protein product [Diabrotica balteata]
MSDEDYNHKMEELKKYMPFLEKMINQLKTDPNKKFQLTKIESLYAMIRDKKLKIDTLNKCQHVISKIYKKMNPKSIESDKDTTRTVCCSSSDSSKVLASSERMLHHTVDGYASARDSMKDNLKSDEQKKRFSLEDVTIISNPPINFEDLKCLEIDVQKKLNRTSSVTELGDKHKVTNKLMVTNKPTHDHQKDCVKADYNLNLANRDVKDHSNDLHLSKSIPLIPKVSSHSTEENSSDFGSILSKTGDKLKEIDKEQEEYRYVYIHVEKNKEEAKKNNGSDKICLTKNENYKKYANTKNNDNQIAREMNMFQKNDQLLDNPMNTNLSNTGEQESSVKKKIENFASAYEIENEKCKKHAKSKHDDTDITVNKMNLSTTITPNSVLRGINVTHNNPQGLNLLASSNENFVSAYEIEYNASRGSHDPPSTTFVPNITLLTSNMEEKYNQPFSNNHREPPQYYSTQNTGLFSPTNHIPPVLSVSVPHQQDRKQNQNKSSCGLVNKVIHKQETNRDPRVIKNSRDKHSKEIKDPRLNKNIVSNRKPNREKENNVTKPNLDVAGKSNEDIRLIRGRSSSLEDSRSDQYESKFDLIYSRINRHESCARSKSPTKPVSSSSDSTNGNKEQHKSSAGYGLQSFRIPKKNKQETEKAKEPHSKPSKETVNQDKLVYHHSNKNVNLNKCQGDSKDSLDCVNKKPYVLVSNPRIPPANNIPNKTDFIKQINRREIKNSSLCVDNGQLKVCTKSAIHGLQTYGISKKKRKRRRKAKQRETEKINETINQYGIEIDHQNRNINCSHGEESTDSSGSLNTFKSIPVSTMNDIPNKTNLNKTLNSRQFGNSAVGVDNDALEVCKESAIYELQRFLTSKKKKAHNRKAQKQEIETNKEINKSAVDQNHRNKNVDPSHDVRKNKGSFDYLNKTKPVLEPIANDTPNKKHLNKTLNKRDIKDSSISFSSFRIPKKNKEDKEIATEQDIKTSNETINQNEVEDYNQIFLDINTNLNKRIIDHSYAFVDNKALEACLEGAGYELEDIPVPKNKTSEKGKVKKQETETSKETINQDKVEQDHLNKNVDPTHVEGEGKDSLGCLNKTKYIPVSSANDTSDKMDLNNSEIENKIVFINSSTLDVSKPGAKEILHSVQISKKTKMSKETINQDKVKQDQLNKSVDSTDGEDATKESSGFLNKTKSISVSTANDISNKMDLNKREIENNTVCIDSSTFGVSKQGAREVLNSRQISKKVTEERDKKVQDTEMSIKTNNHDKVEQDHSNKNVDLTHGEGTTKESSGCLNKTKSISILTANVISNRMELNKREIENNTVCIDSSTFGVSKQVAREVLHSGQISKKVKEEANKEVQDTEMSIKTNNHDKVEQEYSNKNVDLAHCEGTTKESSGCLNKTKSISVSTANVISNKKDLNKGGIENNTVCIDSSTFGVSKQGAREVLDSGQISKKVKEEGDKKVQDTEKIIKTNNQDKVEQDHSNKNVDLTHGEGATKESSGCINKTKFISVSNANDISNKMNLNKREIENNTVCIDSSIFGVSKQGAREVLHSAEISKKAKEEGDKKVQDTDMRIKTNNQDKVEQDHLNKNVDLTYGKGTTKESSGCLNTTKTIPVSTANDTLNKMDLNKKEIENNTVCIDSSTFDVSKQGAREVLHSNEISKKVKEEGDKKVQDTDMSIKTNNQDKVEQDHSNKNVDLTYGEGTTKESSACLYKTKSISVSTANDISKKQDLNKREIENNTVCIDSSTFGVSKQGAREVLHSAEISKKVKEEGDKKVQDTDMSIKTNNQDKVEQDHSNKNVDLTYGKGTTKESSGCLYKTKSISVSTVNDTSNRMEVNKREIENNTVCIDSSTFGVSKQGAIEVLHSGQISKMVKEEGDKKAQETEMSIKTNNQDKLEQDHLNKNVDLTYGEGTTKETSGCFNTTKSIPVSTANDTTNKMDLNKREIENNTVCIDSSIFGVSKQGAREVLHSAEISKKAKEEGDKKVQDTDMRIKTNNQDKVEQDHLNKNVDLTYGKGTTKESSGCLNTTKSIPVSTANDTLNKMDLNKKEIENNTVCVDSSTFDVSKQGAREVLHSAEISKKVKEEGDKKVQDTDMSIKTNNQDKVEQDHSNKNVDLTYGEGTTKESSACLYKTKSISVSTANDISNKKDLNKREIENNTVCIDSSTFGVSKQGAREVLHSAEISKKVKEEGDKKVQDTDMSIKTNNQDKVEQDHSNKNVDLTYGEGTTKESSGCLYKTKSISVSTVNDTSNRMEVNKREIENNTVCIDSSTFGVSKQGAIEVLHSGQISKMVKEEGDKKAQETEMSIKTNNQDKLEQDHLNKNVDLTYGEGTTKETSGCFNTTKSIPVSTANDTTNKMDLNKREIENNTVCVDSSTFDVSKQGAREVLHSVQISKKVKEEGDKKVQDTEMSIKTINQDKVEQDHLNKNVDLTHGEGVTKESSGYLNKTKSISVSTANDISNKMEIENNTLCVDSSTFGVSKQGVTEVLHSGQISKKIKEERDKKVQDTERSKETINQNKVEQGHLNKNIDLILGEGATKESSGCLNKIKSISVSTAIDISNKIDLNKREIENNTICVDSSTFDVSKQVAREVLHSGQISKKVKEEGDKKVQDTEMSKETINQDKVERNHLNKNVDRIDSEGASKDSLVCLNKTKSIQILTLIDIPNKIEIEKSTVCVNNTTFDACKEGAPDVLQSFEISKKKKWERENKLQLTEMNKETINQNEVDQDHLDKNVDRTYGYGESNDLLICLDKTKSIPVSTSNDSSNKMDLNKREIKNNTVCVDSSIFDVSKQDTRDVLHNVQMCKNIKEERYKKAQDTEMSKETINQDKVEQDHLQKNCDISQDEGKYQVPFYCLNKTNQVSTANDISNKTDVNTNINVVEIEVSTLRADNGPLEVSKEGARDSLRSFEISKKQNGQREQKEQETEMHKGTIDKNELEQNHPNKNVDISHYEEKRQGSLDCINKTKYVPVSTANNVLNEADLSNNLKERVDISIYIENDTPMDVTSQCVEEKEPQTSIIIENQIRNHLDVDSKTKNNENSQFYQPSTSKNTEKSVKTPIEQSILAKHFANLLGSQDKQEKKTAIYSLISTFSDSFSPKELHKINKIINSKDEYEDSSDEELSIKTNISNTNKNISHEEVNVNGIKDQDNAHEKVITKHQLKESITSYPVKQHTNEVEGNLLSKKTAGGEDILEDTRNYMDQENEMLVVTVEENIKSKREPILGDKPRKKRGSELDRLHEDIREMFIRDDVLTASGKRMCHMLKDSSIATNTENIENNTEKIVCDAIKKVRPKCKNKKQKTMKDLTVIECNEACTSAELTKSFEYSNSYSNKEVELVSDDSQNNELLKRKHASSSLVGIIVKKKKKLNFDELTQPKLTDIADLSAVSSENKVDSSYHTIISDNKNDNKHQDCQNQSSEGGVISNAVKRIDIYNTVITSDRNDQTYEATPPSVINKPIQLTKAFNLALMNLETETRNGQETTLKRVKDEESPCGDPQHSGLFHTDSYNKLEQGERTHTRIAADKGSMITQSKLDATFLCKPYRCVPGCHLEFLFENEFSDHIIIAHKKKHFLICGHDSCSRQVKPADISRHWSVWHNVSVYQCSYCQSNTNELDTMNYHLSIAHPNVNPEILVRILSPKMSHYVFYTPEAFSKLRKIVDVPNIPSENTDTRAKSLNEPNLVVSSPQNSSTMESNNNSVSANTSTLLSTPTTLKIISNSSTPLTNSSNISSLIELSLPISPVDKPLHRTELEETSSSSNQKSSPCGLLDYQLFKCATCMLAFSTLKAFKKHVTKSEECKNKDNINKPFVCVHCNKSYKNCNTLCVHIQYHGVSRYSCSVCGNKFHTFRQGRGHMKRRHNVSDTTQIVVNSASASNGEKYIIERKQLKADQHVYKPEDIGKIPLQSIFSTNLRCGTCPYTTKVRMNMTRHLQFHLQKIPVPSKSPINPVQYMVNNGASISPAPPQISDICEASIVSDKNDTSNFPDFVPSCLRYTCCAKGCKYICPEEENLRHHFTVLHSQELNFSCVHCKVNLNSDANDIINHLNLHGSYLYKCQYCDYVHNIEHKIERHIKDKHKDFSLKVITLRCIELEPKDIEDTSNKVPVSVAVTRVLNTTPFCEDSESARPMRPSMPFDKSTPIRRKSLTRETEIFTPTHSKNITSQKLPVPMDMLSSAKYIGVDEMIDRINQLIKTDLNDSNNIANDEDSAVTPKQKDARDLPFEESSSDLIKRFQESRLQFYSSTIKPSIIITPRIMDLTVSINPLLSTKCNDKEDMIDRINQLIKLDLSDIIIVSDDEDHETNININQNIDVAGYKFEEEFGEQSLIKTFGSFGLPFVKQLKCPKCNNFKSRRMSDFIFHIFRENETNRYGCKICSAVSVTYKCMYSHVHMQHKPFDVNNIICLPKNPRLEAWLQMLIKTQCTVIIGISSKPQEITPDSTLNKVLCRFCNKWYKSEDEHQHAMFHWASTPFKCSDCRFEAYTRNQVLQHHIAASHGKGEISIIHAGPTVASELGYFDFLHMKEAEEERSKLTT